LCVPVNVYLKHVVFKQADDWSITPKLEYGECSFDKFKYLPQVTASVKNDFFNFFEGGD